MTYFHTFMLALSCAGSLLAPVAASASSLTTVYKFKGGEDGAGPRGLIHKAGGLYGVTHNWGSTSCLGEGCGTIFSINPAMGVETRLYAFKGAPADGSYGFSGLTYHAGMFYGASGAGGGADMGTVYSFDPATGIETTLYEFRGYPNDGAYPFGTLIYRDGALYGTTGSGGSSACGGAGCGTVFRLDVARRTETVLYSFKGGNDGANPFGGLAYNAGSFYGTTEGEDAATDYGTVFAVNASTGAETVLHQFGGGSDGAFPLAGLNGAGTTLFGTTQGGDTAGDNGTVFKIDLAATPPTETVLHRFGANPDGALPEADMLLVGHFLYGTTVLGGGKPCGYGSSCGTVFRVDTSTGAETVMHAFRGRGDGSYPEAPLTLDGGLLYGTTSFGGVGCGGVGCGTVFSIKP